MKTLIYLTICLSINICLAQKPVKHFTYLALGDSYTIGESVDRSETYPYLLTDTLEGMGFIADTSIVIAKTGWTTDELWNAIIERNINNTKFDLVTLLIGVNNQYRGRSADNYTTEFTKLLEKAISFAGNSPNKVIVLSIPDWGVTPFAKDRGVQKIASEINQFNTINKEISLQCKVNYIDITGISRKARYNSELLAEDGLHPSGTMYKLWVKKVIPVAIKIINN